MSLLAALTLAATCAPLPGADAVLARAETRWIMLGEIHGTAEMPVALTDLACLAGERMRPVVVAIEQTVENQPILDRYLVSDGGEAARAALLAAPMWRGRWKDGRSSEAMLAMIERLRIMKRARRIARVVAFDPDVSESSADRNALMAKNLRAIDPGRGGVVLVLVGGLHAQKSEIRFGPEPYPAAAQLLPREATVSLMMLGDVGTAWVCMEAEQCGVTPVGAPRKEPRGISMMPAPDGSFDGILDMGRPLTASPPAVGTSVFPEPAAGAPLLR